VVGERPVLTPPHAAPENARGRGVKQRKGARVWKLLWIVWAAMLSAGTALAAPLSLVEADDQNQSRLIIQVTVSDGITQVLPFQESILLREGGTGSLELAGPIGILRPFFGVTQFGIVYPGGNTFSSVVGNTGIPITLSIDTARFTVRNLDGSGISGFIEVGSLYQPLGADTLEAALTGSVTLGGQLLPFALYDPIQSCAFSCLEALGGFPTVFLDALDSVEVTGSAVFPFRRDGVFEFPSHSANLGSVDGLSVSVSVQSLVERATFVPEPSTGILFGIGLLALTTRRLRSSSPSRS
jgi:hypothetical protein